MAQTGWKPLPLSLKILFVVFIFWIIGSTMNLSMRMDSGLPFYGLYLYGLSAGIIVVVLDILAPLLFLLALWLRKIWGVTFALGYNGIFILNSIIAVFTIREQLGLLPILLPAMVSVLFCIVIFRSKEYFTQ